ncbi:MAG: helix-turn-helix domain-containing protein [Bacteroidales bacterium]|nr:helix-turn-helix domain-containing protein [Bacteroidales bacterium]
MNDELVAINRYNNKRSDFIHFIGYLEHIEKLCDPEPNTSVLPDVDRLLDNYDLCKMLNVSKRTLQRYRTSGDLPYQMIYHETFYRESDMLRFIERNFSNFRKMKKEQANNSSNRMQ